MDHDIEKKLAPLIRAQRVASFGTVRDGAPLITLVLYAPAPDFSEFYIRISRLALHTASLQNDPRVSLMIAESDTRAINPQTLARVSIQGDAAIIPATDPQSEKIKTLYLEKFPQQAITFQLGDFATYRIAPRTARFVAGFAAAFDLTPGDFRRVANQV
ncbi:MAG: pyridoxamine 5'-phosphate oxidase family protein [Chloroflexi bacterium]|nr:pyridoxamine 5'-phosphate oxidase family protein [Chloroflexota bacterium]